MRDKNGQVNTLAPAIIALIFAAIVLVFGLVMSQELRDTQTATILATVANESLVAWTGTANQTVDKVTECGFGSITTASVVVYNVTGSNVIIPAANYTVWSDGNMINTTDHSTLRAWRVSYPYTWGGEACVGANATVVGLGSFADFWEIIVLAIVITVVIGLLLIIFGGTGRRR